MGALEPHTQGGQAPGHPLVAWGGRSTQATAQLESLFELAKVRIAMHGFIPSSPKKGKLFPNITYKGKRLI